VTLQVVAIDGAAGSGKSTLARGLAGALRLPYVNTGVMYRALTHAALTKGVDLADGSALADLMSSLRFELGNDSPPELEVEGAPPGPELEGPDVEAHVSQVAAHPQVRELMRRRQRALGLAGGVVEGRDIGSVVFPDAPVKLFLVAEPAERVERRALERDSATPGVAAALEARDERDARVNPFAPAAGALVIDTTAMDVDTTLEAALGLVSERAPELIP
jgi:cytidylate kinase